MKLFARRKSAPPFHEYVCEACHNGDVAMANHIETNGTTKDEMGAALTDVLPDLRAFARSLTKDRVLADDLVQDAAVRALTSAHLFMRGTNLKAWLFTILRNCFYNNLRSRQREAALPSNDPESHGASQEGHQESCLALCDFRRAFWQLSSEHREVLMLVGPSGLSYEMAGEVCGCAVGTIKSRVSRARSELYRILKDEDIRTPRSQVSPVSISIDTHMANLTWLQETPALQETSAARIGRPV
jgi:RNA polymerase sigma-70 factor (ECF subfamily)